MKNKDFVQTTVILPIVSALILSIAFFVFFKCNSDIILPFPQNAVIANHDHLVSDNKRVSDKKTFDEIKSNDNIGTVSAGDTDYIIRFEADYSNMISSLSLQSESVQFGEIGTVYLSSFYKNGQAFEDADRITIDSIFGNYEYKKADSFTADNEYKILSSSFKGKTIVIYYQKTDGVGLSSDYQAIVYEEVA